jgi:ABC-type glutathione transport system ATPase component
MIQWAQLHESFREGYLQKVLRPTVRAIAERKLQAPKLPKTNARSSQFHNRTATDFNTVSSAANAAYGRSTQPQTATPTEFKAVPLSSSAPNDAIPQLDGSAGDSDFHVEIDESAEPVESAPVRLSMAELFEGRTPEQLEKSVEKGVELLSEIQSTLQQQPSQDATQWIQALETVQKQAVRAKTVVGVVGATGAGKSSVINAMLDEERLVPTNCMRACTAVVTETAITTKVLLTRPRLNSFLEMTGTRC